MEATDTSWWAWGVATVVGPILLAIALAYGVAKTKPWKRGPKAQGPIPPEQRTVNAASWGAEDRYGDRPQPDTDPQGAARAASRQTADQQRAGQRHTTQQQAAERETVIQLDDRSR
jgi:hypothetical protein